MTNKFNNYRRFLPNTVRAAPQTKTNKRYYLLAVLMILIVAGLAVILSK